MYLKRLYSKVEPFAASSFRIDMVMTTRVRRCLTLMFLVALACIAPLNAQQTKQSSDQQRSPQPGVPTNQPELVNPVIPPGFNGVIKLDVRDSKSD